MLSCAWFNTNYFIAVIPNNTALTTYTRSNPRHLVPCGTEHKHTISFSQALSTNLTDAIILFVLFLVMSSIWSYYVCVLF